MSVRRTILTLSETCAAFVAAQADYNRNAPEENEAANAYAQVTFLPWMEKLEDWRRPAETHEDAVAALRVAISEAQDFDTSPPIVPMIRAALSYWEGLANEVGSPT